MTINQLKVLLRKSEWQMITTLTVSGSSLQSLLWVDSCTSIECDLKLSSYYSMTGITIPCSCIEEES